MNEGVWKRLHVRGESGVGFGGCMGVGEVEGTKRTGQGDQPGKHQPGGVKRHMCTTESSKANKQLVSGRETQSGMC